MQKEEILGIFETKAKDFNQTFLQYNALHKRLSLIRIFVFAVAIVLIVYFANDRNVEMLLATFFIFLLTFIFLVKYHNKITSLQNLYLVLHTINKEESYKLKGNLKTFPNGKEFLDTNHPYANDIDIFGDHSLFQLLDRTTSNKGKNKLAQWISYPANKQEIHDRQKAVSELKDILGWRQGFQAKGKLFDNDCDVNTLTSWLQEPESIKHKHLYIVALIVLPLAMVLSLVLWLTIGTSYYLPLTGFVINTIVLKTVFQAAKNTTDKACSSLDTLKAYKGMIGQVNTQSFSTPKLVSLKQSFKANKVDAKEEITSLQTILDFLETRANLIYAIVNIIFLLDIFWLLKADRWRQKNKEQAAVWFDTLAEFEALNSLAGFAYANPDYALPIIIDEPHFLEIKEGGHPLIFTSRKVTNDFELKGKGAVAIITGSNMAGKSTFLRTVGLNTVLALAGAPVCAHFMQLSITQVFTSMRTQDNLEESVSSFYAELKRLRQLLDLLENGRPVLYLLDEILKGTNSKDRHTGASALVQQLSKLNASGLVSTHDLELAALEQTVPNAKNYSFTSQIAGEEIIFDYKLRPGVCKSFNASKLMAKMGIQIPN
jgi:hypothetical protein